MNPTNQPDHFTENIEQTQESTQAPSVISQSEQDKVQQLASGLLAELQNLPDGDQVGEIITTALKLLRDHTNRGDMKLINKSMKELRYALKVFAPYQTTRKVSIFGSARTMESHVDYQQAMAFAKRMTEQNWMVITGAGGGIMAAGHGGAGADLSFGLAIRLPFEQHTNAFIANDPKLVTFKYFFTRKLMFVRSSHAITLFPGGFGTMDEGFEVLTLIQTGKCVPMPIVFIDRPGGDYWSSWQDYVEKQLLARGLIGPDDFNLYRITDNLDEAVHEVTHFYSNYHSVRYTHQDIVIRLQRRPSEAQLAQINTLFADINVSGEFRISGALPVERDEPALSHLHRLVFTFNRRDHARLRMLINFLNDLPNDLPAAES